eukprot:TRINITY_DN30138_c0_g1_i1.p3 TRINITY_DN30138_c0_g1~~TRINITY_DN30138_c0_g1_i1.p3  ORF type:complete len:278 (-),score=0.39 TRINITY_DN30138_c0_g1_i1:22-855(-)
MMKQPSASSSTMGSLRQPGHRGRGVASAQLPAALQPPTADCGAPAADGDGEGRREAGSSELTARGFVTGPQLPAAVLPSTKDYPAGSQQRAAGAALAAAQYLHQRQLRGGSDRVVPGIVRAKGGQRAQGLLRLPGGAARSQRISSGRRLRSGGGTYCSRAGRWSEKVALGVCVGLLLPCAAVFTRTPTGPRDRPEPAGLGLAPARWPPPAGTPRAAPLLAPFIHTSARATCGRSAWEGASADGGSAGAAPPWPAHHLRCRRRVGAEGYEEGQKLQRQ